MGAEPALEFLKMMDREPEHEIYFTGLEARASSAQLRERASRRLRLLEIFRRSGNRMQDMILTELPVLPPDLRPMVQLDGGRFATSDLNDLYRRTLSRNYRLKRFTSIRAPSLIIRNEKRMLQEAVDSLIDNGRQSKPVKGKRDHELKSLSDLLKGKHGRFRQNLLGKRVDYSGRSVIVVGPELRMDQCGLPKRMALELFKPFVMHRLVADGLAPNIRAARRMVERSDDEVWPLLEDIIRDRPVLLNRAPTLHRLGLQAFYPALIEGSAIQLHPLACSAFNADFDGDQMAVHVPLTEMAVNEARTVMLSVNNMLSPASGDPLVNPNLDMVMGCYYLTEIEEGAPGAGSRFHDAAEARLAYASELVGLRASIILARPPRNGNGNGNAATETETETVTSVGRLIFNEALPEAAGFRNCPMNRGALTALTADLYARLNDNELAAQTLDRIKDLGFHYATRSGISIAISDLQTPDVKADLIGAAERKVADLEECYMLGMMTAAEKDEHVIATWTETMEKMEAAVSARMSDYGGVATMASSGTKGNIAQIKQMAGMGGLMTSAAARGEIKTLPTPVKSSFREGLTPWEYFIRTHGARRTQTDTALRTATSGYTTRRLIDVAQEVIVRIEDCAYADPYLAEPYRDDPEGRALPERIRGRLAGDLIVHPGTGEILADRDELIDEDLAQAIRDAGLTAVPVRSPLTCEARQGVCQRCYGVLPATGRLVEIGQAVGVIAAQSIGEPGTQLTLRTFHSGGVARERGSEIVAGRGRGNEEEKTGLPRVEQLFEAYVVKPDAPIVGRMSHIDGVVESVSRLENGIHQIRIVNEEEDSSVFPLPPAGVIMLTRQGEAVQEGAPLAALLDPDAPADADPGAGAGPAGLAGARVESVIRADRAGEVEKYADRVGVVWREYESRLYEAPAQQEPLVSAGETVYAGQALSTGQLPLPEVLELRGQDGLRRYFIEEVQAVYRSQGVSIHDKHIEVILRQMMRRVEVTRTGDTRFLAGDIVDQFRFQEQNEATLAAGGEPATARPLLMGASRAALNTDSFLSKASFQETARVLMSAAVAGDVDTLRGLKENVIIGRLVPARLQSLLDAERELLAARRRADADVILPAWMTAGGDADAEAGEALAGLNLPDGGGLAIAAGVDRDHILSGGGGFQTRSAAEEDEDLQQSRSLAGESVSEAIDQEAALTAIRIFSPFDDDDDDYGAETLPEL